MTRFYPATPKLWSIIPYGIYTAIELAWRCRLVLDRETLQRLKDIPSGIHLIIVCNHADEMDIRVFMECARRAGKRFQFMVNAEAFEEMRGFAGFWMTRVGCFSVERGAADTKAREHAIETIKRAKEALVMFPEGEIYYLNDQVQPFKTGAVRLGFEALQEIQRTDPVASVYILPAAIKYSYQKPIAEALKQRLQQLENKIQLNPGTQEIQARLTLLMKHVMERYRMKSPLSGPWVSRWNRMTEDISAWRSSILTRFEKKYAQIWDRPAQQLMDRAYRLIAGIRERMSKETGADASRQRELHRDLSDLKRTVWFASWAPQYHENKPSAERLAESVIKLEREIMGTPRPKPLGKRSVRIQIGELVNLGAFAREYEMDEKSACRKITDKLQKTIQGMIENASPAEKIHE